MNNRFIDNLKTKLQILVIASVSVFSGCGGDPEPAPTEAERVTRLLTAGGGTWVPSSNGGITVDGVDVTDELFPGFSITFSESTFTTTGTSPVWLQEDTWRFKDNTAKVIIRGQDEREVTLTEVSAAQIKLTLEWPATTTSGGRSGSLKGTHEFVLNK